MSKGRVRRGQVEMVFRTHGGKRPGAGRKPKSKRPGERHAPRPEHDPRHPVHVTIRVVGSASGLRRRDIYLAVREATIVTAKREDFRIVQMSIQRDHIHLLVEADSKAALSNGVRGFSISAARQINREITARGGERRTGKVIGDRFHARPLTSPRAVRNTLAYIQVNRSILGERFRWPPQLSCPWRTVLRPWTSLLARGWQEYQPPSVVPQAPALMPEGARRSRSRAARAVQVIPSGGVKRRRGQVGA